MKILLAVDGSSHTQKMLAYLTTHPALFGPQHAYTCFTAVAPLPPRARAAVGAEIAHGHYLDEIANVTTPVLAYLAQHGITAEVAHQVGSAGEWIAKTAIDGQFDLVVMGSHGHGALANLVMGSVVTQVLAHCTVPVLLVR